MTFVILTAGIDLSVGAIVALTGVITTSLLKLDLPLAFSFPFAVFGGIAVGILSGLIAGFFIVRFNITPFIVTLALMTIWRGTAFLYTGGRPIWDLPEAFTVLATGRVLGIPLPTLLMLVVFLMAHVMLRKTKFGRYVYAVGGNREAARLAGVNTSRILVSVYIISGALSALGGILLAGRINSGQPNAGLMYELDVIAAVVVGGTSLFGGRGSVVGTLIGSLLISVLRNGLNLLNVESYMQQIVVGVVVLLAVMMDHIKKKTT